MIYKLIALIIITILVVFLPQYADVVMNWIIMGHAKVVDFLGSIFSDGQTGRIIRDFLSILAMPFAVGIVLGLIYWLVRRRFFPYFVFVVWSLWLLELGALIVLHRL